MAAATICYWDIRGLAQPIRNSLLVDPKVLRLICFRIWLLEEIMIRYSTKSAIENCRKNKQTNLVILLITKVSVRSNDCTSSCNDLCLSFCTYAIKVVLG
jgi:hypothetical protein